MPRTDSAFLASFSVLICAAGRASRMGQVKPLLPLTPDTDPFLPSASALGFLSALYRGAGITDLWLVSGFHAELVEEEAKRLGISIVRNPAPAEGMFSSVRCGLRALLRKSRPSWLIVHPADVPLVRPLTIDLLLSSCREEQEKGTEPSSVLVPTFAGKSGHPPVIPAARLALICEAPKTANLRALLMEGRTRFVPVCDANVLLDMDTRADLARLRRRAELRQLLVPEEALRLLEMRAVPEKGIRHGRAVGRVAFALGHCLKARGKGVRLRPWLAMACGFLHDIGKGREPHEEAGAALLRALSLQPMADVIQDHRDLLLPDDSPITERELVYLADKYCFGSSYVPLSRRFYEKLQRWPENREERAAIRGRYARAADLALRFLWETGEEPATIACAALRTASVRRGLS